ncbi:MAG: RDD family protein [Vicinamibacterales bacterium]|nr:RDD family protein [Vicinamibacterales bacterium]
MKCPKCGYLGFDSGERCRNCGYDFSLASPPAGQPGGRAGRVTPGGPPLRDPRLARGAHFRQSARTQGTEGADRSLASLPEGAPVDLPLFGGDLPQLPPPRAPLAVRRATPTPARVRTRTPAAPPDAIPLLGRDPGEIGSEAEAGIPQAGDTRAARTEWPAATAGRRAAAAAIDLGLVVVIDVVVLHFTLALCGLTFNDLRVLPVLPMAAFLLVLNLGYVVLFTGTLGQTFGKMATAIEVVSDRRTQMDLRRAALRGAALVISLLPAGLGWLAGLVGDRRGLHDRLAGTRVVPVTGA